MGLDVEQYPPYKTEAFKLAYERTGYDSLEQGADEAALYEHALDFLDRFIEEAKHRGLELRHRLDAQSLVWLSKYDDFWNLPFKEENDPPLSPSSPSFPSSPSEDYLTVLAGQRQWIATTNFAGCAGRPPDSFANSVVLATSAKVPDALG